MASTGKGVYSVLDNNDLNAMSDFFMGFDRGIQGSYATQIGDLIPSNSEIENYTFLANSPQLEKWEGAMKLTQLKNFSYELKNELFSSALNIQKKDFDRDKTGQISRRITGLGEEASTHWGKLVSEAIIANGLCYDGQNFFDTDHDESGASQVNALTATQIASANVGTATAPTAVEMAKIIVETIGYMQSYKKSNGEPANAAARNFLVVSGTPQINAAVVQAVGIDNLDSGATNPVRGYTQSGYGIQFVLDSRLSAQTDKVYVFATDEVGIKPFILQEEDGIELWEQDNGPMDQEFYFGAKASRSVGYGDWKKAAQVTMS